MALATVVENAEDRALRLISQRNNILGFGGPLLRNPRISSNWTTLVWSQIPLDLTDDYSED